MGALVAVLALATTSALAMVTAPTATAAHESVCDAVATNVVRNCGFDTGSFPPWVLGGDTSFSSVQPTVKNSGTHAAQVAPSGTGTLSQTLTVTPGTQYEVSFYLWNNVGGTNSFTASMTNADTGGGTSGTATLVTLTNVGHQDFTKYTHTVTPTASSSTLTFTYQNEHGIFVLDDVVVSPVGGGTTTTSTMPTTTSTSTTSTTMPTTTSTSTTSTTMPTTTSTSTTSTTMPTSTTSTTMATTTTSTTVGHGATLNCVRTVNDAGAPIVRCQIADANGLRRVNVVDTTTRVREQSIAFPLRPAVTAATFTIPDDGNAHRIHLNDAGNQQHTWLVGPDGTVTPL